MRNVTLKKKLKKLLSSSGDHEIYKKWSDLLETINSNELSADLLRSIGGNKSALRRVRFSLKKFSNEFNKITGLLNERIDQLYSMKKQKQNSSSQEIDNIEYIIKKYGSSISFELLEKIINDDEF